ncbi:MAG: hypothetical protein FWG66_07535 [Spirochaetes bacterium]|nr:hypothetical protein [Spirochaetota bacterium]
MKILQNFVSRLKDKQPKPNSVVQEKKSATPVLSFVFFIVDWSTHKLVCDVFDKENVSVYFVHKARGTASSERLDLLGVGASDKALITCLEHPGKIPTLVKKLQKKISSNSPGGGIAFTIPLSAANSPLLQAFKDADGGIAGGNIAGGDDGWDGEPVKKSYTGFPYALIYSVVNIGYSGEFMSTAKKAGAPGGIIIHARNKATEGAIKFFGVSVQEEREVILMLTSQEKKGAVMQAIYDSFGLGSKAQGLIFSMPVDQVVSLSFEQELS